LSVAASWEIPREEKKEDGLGLKREMGWV